MDYYKILEVIPEASAEVIRASYRALARKYHSDNSKETVNHEMMININEAYSVLSDRVKRMAYDSNRINRESGFRSDDCLAERTRRVNAERHWAEAEAELAAERERYESEISELRKQLDRYMSKGKSNINNSSTDINKLKNLIFKKDFKEASKSLFILDKLNIKNKTIEECRRVVQYFLDCPYEKFYNNGVLIGEYVNCILFFDEYHEVHYLKCYYYFDDEDKKLFYDIADRELREWVINDIREHTVSIEKLNAMLESSKQFVENHTRKRCYYTQSSDSNGGIKKEIEFSTIYTKLKDIISS